MMDCRSAPFVCVAAALLLLCAPINGEVLVGNLPTLAHSVSGKLYIIDSKTLVIRNFNYDSGGPDAFLYYYAPGVTPDRQGGGIIIPHPVTGGKFPRGTAVVNQNLQFTLQADVFACDIGTFTIWCRFASQFFTQLAIPASLFTKSASEVASDQNKILCREETGGGGGGGGTQPTRPTNDDFDNCKQLDESLSLAWTVNRTTESVDFMLCGCRANDMGQTNTWMGFGLSGSTSRTKMVGADASIVWVDNAEGAMAQDYYLSAYTQCRNGVGACPDTLDSSRNCSNNVVVRQGWLDSGQQCVIFSRNFTANDACDLELDPDNENQYVVWGVGGLGETAFRHFLRAQGSDPPLHLGRNSSRNCSALKCASCDAFEKNVIDASTTTTFVARIGPNGGTRGYMGITGQAGWGIAWYINKMLIPELVVRRGSTYTFIIYGGDDPNKTADYHPFYITSSISGGRLLNTELQKRGETVYAGFDSNDKPIGVGPLCSINETAESTTINSNCTETLTDYQNALANSDQSCGSNLRNILVWRPDDNTPNLVYYQCASHLNLGWKITVMDGALTLRGTLTLSLCLTALSLLYALF